MRREWRCKQLPHPGQARRRGNERGEDYINITYRCCGYLFMRDRSIIKLCNDEVYKSGCLWWCWFSSDRV